MSEQGSTGCVPQSNSPEEKDKTPSRVVLNESELSSLSSSEFVSRWRLQDNYVASLEQRLAQQEGELAELRQAADRTRSQLAESQQREKVLVRRLAAKEQETQDYVVSTPMCSYNGGSNVQIAFV